MQIQEYYHQLHNFESHDVYKIPIKIISYEELLKNKMCVTFFCFRPNTKKRNVQLILTFNRDEARSRQTLPFGPFSDDKNIYAGRDMISGGTWLGMNILTGIMVILTNYHLQEIRVGLSRGKLVHKFLSTSFVEGINSDEETCQKITEQLSAAAKLGPEYSPFNLVVYHIRSAKFFYICSQTKMNQPQNLTHGHLYALSNADLHTEWPKTKHGRQIFEKILSKLDQLPSGDLFKMLEQMMKDKTTFPENSKSQSSLFIEPYYSQKYKTFRETKTTFISLFIRTEKRIQLHTRQITYHPQLSQSVVSYDFFI